MCYIYRMPASSADRYRRPFLMQLTAAESDRLDRLGSQRGSKRQAVLDGLALLESGAVEALQTRVGDLEQERDRVAAEAATAAQQAALAGTTCEAARGELAATTRQLREARAALRVAKTELRETTTALASAQQDVAAAQAEARRLAALVPHHAFCGACGKYVPEAEWAEQADPKGGVHLYHQPHGYRPRASLGQGASLLFWLAKSRERAE